MNSIKKSIDITDEQWSYWFIFEDKFNRNRGNMFFVQDIHEITIDYFNNEMVMEKYD